jgi:hypothetical protein
MCRSKCCGRRGSFLGYSSPASYVVARQKLTQAVQKRARSAGHNFENRSLRASNDVLRLSRRKHSRACFLSSFVANMADLMKACHWHRTCRLFCRWSTPRRSEEISAANMIVRAMARSSRVASDNEAQRGATDSHSYGSGSESLPLRSMAAARVRC